MRIPPLPLTHGAGVLVGFSGGLDSTVLLHSLALDPAMRARGLRAVHVHHGLHPDADAWALHCERSCAALGVALQVVRVEVARDSGLGLEGAARAARYRAFAQALDDDGVLALAHHLSDQAETLLLRALRGSGVDGLAAMRPWRRLEHGWLWRPLLDAPREHLLAYARAHRLEWIDDPTNAHDGAERNFLRLRVLPLLRERWPHADVALARSAALAAQASDLLAQADATALDAASVQADTLRLDALLRLPRERRARVLRRWIHGLGLPPPPARALARLEGLLNGAGQGEVAWSGVRARRWRGLLHAGTAPPALPSDWQCEWDGRQVLALPTGGVLELIGARFDTPLQVRARRGGERIVLPGRAHSHALKHVLQDAAVPPWKRLAIPLLCDVDGSVLAAGDAVLSARLHAWLQERGAALRWRPAAMA